MKQIPLTGKNGLGKFALIDNETLHLLSKCSWMVGKDGYARRGEKIKGTRRSITKYMHRDVISFYGGDIPNGLQVDHINMNKLDNRKENLRIASRSQNHMNMNKNHRNTSGFKGIVFNKRLSKWEARIKINQRQIYLGLFDKPQDAALAYNNAAIKYVGEYARLNLI